MDLSRILISRSQLSSLLKEAAELGAMRALTETNNIKTYLSKSEAYRKYSRRNVDRWINEGLIKDHQDGESAKYRINRVEIEAVAKASNRGSYLISKEKGH